MSDVISDPETAPVGSPPIAQINLAELDDKHLGFALGASEFLTKPVDRGQLVALLRKHAHGQAPRKVLLVEDDPVSRAMLSRLMQQEGWVVIEAENGRVALERMARERPDVILLDLMMPGMDGWEFRAAQLKKAALASIPVVVVKAANVASHGMPTLPDVEILRKPFDLDRLLTVIERYAAAAGVRR